MSLGFGRRQMTSRGFFYAKGITIARTGLRVNELIRVSPIRLINEENVQIGVIEIERALVLAREAGLDLVEVSPNEEPPVCRIMDHGKWKYTRSKKTTKVKKVHVSVLKEVRLRPKTGEHDLDVKIKRARGFLAKGDKVLFSMRFRGREMAHQDIGTEMFDDIKVKLEDVAKVETNWSMNGRRLSMVLAPIKSASSK